MVASGRYRSWFCNEHFVGNARAAFLADGQTEPVLVREGRYRIRPSLTVGLPTSAFDNEHLSRVKVVS